MKESSSIYSRINTQEVFCKLDGTIIDFNNNIFNFKKGENIFETHPFFESVSSLVVEEHDILNSFPCVHLDIHNQNLICDVTIKRESNKLTFILLDYTVPYKELNAVAQERNESIINSQLLVLKNQQLEQQREFKNRFLANISHEIRTPLNAIVGFTDVLKNTNLNFEQLELANVITKAGDQLTNLISDMLDVAKIEMGELKIKSEPFSLSEIIENLNQVYFRKAKTKGLKLRVDYDSAINSTLIGDKVRVTQVLENLLQNAIKYTQKGDIHFSIDKSFRRANKVGINFTVKDTGIGIPQDKLPNIFESFYRVNDNDLVGGTGLGLSITKNIIEQLGGKIQVESLLTKGSEFKVYLPFKIDLKTSVKKAAPSKIKNSILDGSEKFNILLVENSEINQLLVVKTLLNHGGFYVDVAVDGEKALQYIQVRDYDVILMDLKMPKLDGFQTTKAIRNLEDKALKKIPIIALTGFATEDQREACLKAGMNDYLTKPFKQEELISVLENVFRKLKK